MVAQSWRSGVALLVLLLSPAVRLSAQTLTVSTAGDAVRIRAPGLSFLRGEPLARLKDGRSVRVELTVMALPGIGKEPIATVRRIFALSYDLWEERFAVTTMGVRPQSASHLTLPAAETWCVEQLTIPSSALGRDAQFWVRLEYAVVDGDGGSDAPESGYTLQALIDALSRRRKSDSSPRALEAGPFRTPARAPSAAR